MIRLILAFLLTICYVTGGMCMEHYEIIEQPAFWATYGGACYLLIFGTVLSGFTNSMSNRINELEENEELIAEDVHLAEMENIKLREKLKVLEGELCVHLEI